MIKIHNVRAGFATNSSSSHSIVMIPPGQRVCSDEDNRFNYGWETFTLADRESKTAYLAVQLKLALEGSNIPSDTAVQLVNTWLGTDYAKSELCEGNVDHQSVWSIFNGTLGKNPRFIKAYHNWLMQDNVVILGGNDNSDGQISPPDSYENEYTNLSNTAGAHVRVREDGDYWVIFDPHSGNKARFSFDADLPEYTKAQTPELVDVKLTDYCTYGCQFCYQSSTKQGQHAEWSNVNATLAALSDLGVFEIAFGGGETTQYPHLAQALERTHQWGMVPNFTTYGVDWLKNEELVKAVRQYVGAIGVSVHNIKDLAKVAKIDHAINRYPNRGWDSRSVKITAQHVVGTLDIQDTALLLEKSWQHGVPMLLLGYKNVGFGVSQKPHDLDGITALMRLQADRVSRPHWGARFYTLGVDTSFVEQFGEVLKEIDVPQVLVTSTEGKFSMYVDCVKMQQGPSSYMPELMVPVDMNQIKTSIHTEFATY
jgi:organic radical activating enzyme